MGSTGGLHLPGCKWQMLNSESTEVVKMKNLNISYFNFITPCDHLDFLCLKFKTVRQSTRSNIFPLSVDFTSCMKYCTKLESYFYIEVHSSL